jgi:hypothetical protein
MISYLYVNQELLGRQLSFKREIEAFKERQALNERELERVSSAARLHKEDKVSYLFPYIMLVKISFSLVDRLRLILTTCMSYSFRLGLEKAICLP